MRICARLVNHPAPLLLKLQARGSEDALLRKPLRGILEAGVGLTLLFGVGCALFEASFPLSFSNQPFQGTLEAGVGLPSLRSAVSASLRLKPTKSQFCKPLSCAVGAELQTPPLHQFWRPEWDSNPRNHGFANRCVKPLHHPAVPALLRGIPKDVNRNWPLSPELAYNRIQGTYLSGK